jgi:hypothetical protein
MNLAEAGAAEEVIRRRRHRQPAAAAWRAAARRSPTDRRRGSTRPPRGRAERAPLAPAIQSQPSIIGQPIVMNGERYTVIGIMPPGFIFPRRGPTSGCRSACGRS